QHPLPPCRRGDARGDAAHDPAAARAAGGIMSVALSARPSPQPSPPSGRGGLKGTLPSRPPSRLREQAGARGPAPRPIPPAATPPTRAPLSAAHAVEPSEQLADPALEARARAISQELRCQVCQNQSIDDSNAPLAADLRRLVRERLQAGDSDRAVFAFLVQRY